MILNSRKSRLWSLSTIFYLTLIFFLFACSQEGKLPPGDPDNGGLFLPDGFEALVVVDSIRGRARHLTVNTNGDIYLK